VPVALFPSMCVLCNKLRLASVLRVVRDHDSLGIDVNPSALDAMFSLLSGSVKLGEPQSPMAPMTTHQSVFSSHVQIDR
jgi:hypothetical protein